ncbi:hypothetical protein [Listeria aquatica]|uniref:hypothetical protein n=1 Tax=Listeria aquatica TaxID=1494960 RepID=UPI0031F553A8
MFSVKEAESLSPFELGLFLEKSAKKAVKNSVPLNAGRGNPNWTAAAPREAFFLLGLFAVSEMERVRQGELSGMPARIEMLGRFEVFLEAQSETPGKNLLTGIWRKGEQILGVDKHDWLFEFVDAITGDNYPNPDRVLNYVEKAIKAYLKRRFLKGLKSHSIFLPLKGARQEFVTYLILWSIISCFNQGQNCTDDSNFHTVFRNTTAIALPI